MGLWTREHFIAIIPAWVVFIGIAILLRRLLAGRDDRVRRIPLQVITAVILVLEVIKQVKSLIEGYDLYFLPFHYCSLFLYLIPLHSFLRGRAREWIAPVTAACGASLVLFMAIVPTVVYSAENVLHITTEFISFHTVVFHHLVCLYMFCAVALGDFRFDTRRDLRKTAIFLAIYVAVATALSFALDVNFHNLKHCNFALVEDVRVALVGAVGWLGQAVYDAVLFVMTIVFAYLSYGVLRLVLRLIDKRKPTIA